MPLGLVGRETTEHVVDSPLVLLKRHRVCVTLDAAGVGVPTLGHDLGLLSLGHFFDLRVDHLLLEAALMEVVVVSLVEVTPRLTVMFARAWCEALAPG